MATRQKYIDDLIDAGASDDEIVEAVKIGESRGLIDNDTAPAEAQKPESKGILSSIDRSLTEHENRVGQQLAQEERYPGQHIVQTASGVLGEIPAAIGPVVNPIIKKGVSLITQVDDPTIDKKMNAVMQPVGEALNKVKDKAPLLYDLAGLGLNASSLVPGIGVGSKVIQSGSEALNTARASAGSSLQDLAKLSQRKNWKLKGTPEQVAAKSDVAAGNDIWGNARKAGDKLQETIKPKYEELSKKILSTTDDPATYADPVKLIDEAKKAALKNASFSGKKPQIESLFESIKGDALEEFKGEPINLAQAQIFKQKIGDLADDVFDVTKKGKSLSAQPVEHQVFANLYDKIKTEIENKGPPGIKEANQELSRLLDLRRDLRARVAVQERNNFMPLDEIVSATGAALSMGHGNPIPAMLYGANVATKSPTVAKAIYDIGTKLAPKKQIAKIEPGDIGTIAYDSKINQK